jgi:hypothetical protein
MDEEQENSSAGSQFGDLKSELYAGSISNSENDDLNENKEEEVDHKLDGAFHFKQLKN